MDIKAAPTHVEHSITTTALMKMRELLDNPDAWIKGQLTDKGTIAMSRDDSTSIAEFMATTKQTCLFGALNKALCELGRHNLNNLNRVTESVLSTLKLTHSGHDCMVDFNDDAETTHDDVLEMLDIAILKSGGLNES